MKWSVSAMLLFFSSENRLGYLKRQAFFAKMQMMNIKISCNVEQISNWKGFPQTASTTTGS